LLSSFWLAGHAAAAEEPSAWPEFSPPKWGFSIRLPAAPKEQVEPTSGATNFQVDTGDKLYTMSVAFVPDEVLKAPPQQILDQMGSSIQQSMPGARIVTSENLKFGGFPATASIIEIPGQPSFKLKTMAVLAGTRFFHLGLMSLADAFVEADADKYFETFKIK
jgi:hypothetical protein